MATVLEGFLVRLGFDIDKDGLAKFNHAMSVGTGAFKLMTKGAIGMGVAVSAGFLKAANSVTKLRNAADNANTSISNLKTLQGTFKALGGSAEQASGMIGGIATILKETPERLRALLDDVGVSMEDANGNTKDTVEIIRDLHEAFAQMNEQEARWKAKNFGIDTAAFDILMKPDFLSMLQKQAELTQKTSKGMEAQAEAARNTLNSISNIWTALKNSGDSLFYQALGLAPVEKWMSKFENWVTNELPAAINGAFSLLRKWLDPNDPASPLKLFNEWWNRHAARNAVKEIGISSKDLKAMNADQFAAWQEENEEYRGLSKEEAIRQIEAIEKLGTTKAGGQIDTARKTLRGERAATKSNSGSLTSVPVSRTGSIGNRKVFHKDGTWEWAKDSSAEEGYRNTASQIVKYGNAGAKSIRDVISTYAPSSDNNPTEAYIKNVRDRVRKATGDNSITDLTALDFHDPVVLKAITDMIVDQEHGAGTSKMFQGSAWDEQINLAAATRTKSRAFDPRKSRTDGSSYRGEVTVNQTINISGAYDPEITGTRVVESTNRAFAPGVV